MVCSSMDEALFFLFSIVRPWTNSGFCYFYAFVHGRTTVFVVFCLSSMDEPWFLLFLVVRPWTNNHFKLYLLNLFKCYSSTSKLTTKIASFYCNRIFIKNHMPRITWMIGSRA